VEDRDGACRSTAVDEGGAEVIALVVALVGLVAALCAVLLGVHRMVK